MSYFYLLVETVLGWVGIAGGEAGLRAVTLPQPSPRAARGELGRQVPGLKVGGEDFGDLPQRLQAYFQGEPVSFSDRLDLSDLTPFLRAVYERTRAIPWGERCSYGTIAAEVGRPRAARAVGQALAHNPWAIIVP